MASILFVGYSIQSMELSVGIKHEQVSHVTNYSLINFSSHKSFAMSFKASDYTRFTDFRITSPAHGVVHVEVNRPKKVNSFAQQTWEQYRGIFDQLNKTDTRAVVLSGVGKHFCSGLDIKTSLKSLVSMDHQSGELFIKEFQDCIASPLKSHIPVISVSHGVSYGLALDIVSATTIRLCTANVRFSIKEIDIGIMADIGSLQRLGYLVNNQSKLNELALTARDFASEAAFDLGLVSNVFEDKKSAIDSAISLAIEISKKYAPAVVGTKKHLEMMTTNSDWCHHGLDSVAKDNAKLMSEDAYRDFITTFMKQMMSRKSKL